MNKGSNKQVYRKILERLVKFRESKHVRAFFFCCAIALIIISVSYVSVELSGKAELPFAIAVVFSPDEEKTVLDWYKLQKESGKWLYGSMEMSKSGQIKISMRMICFGPPVPPKGIVIEGLGQALEDWNCEMNFTGINEQHRFRDFNIPTQKKALYGKQQVLGQMHGSYYSTPIWYLSFEESHLDTFQRVLKQMRFNHSSYTLTVTLTTSNSISPMESPFAVLFRGMYQLDYSFFYWDAVMKTEEYSKEELDNGLLRYRPDELYHQSNVVILRDRTIVLDTIQTPHPQIVLDTRIPGIIEGTVGANFNFDNDFKSIHQWSSQAFKPIRASFKFRSRPFEVAIFGFAAALFLIPRLLRTKKKKAKT